MFTMLLVIKWYCKQLTNDVLFTFFCLIFQDFHRTLLEVESKEIHDNVDMTQIEKLIVNPERENEDQDVSLMTAACEGDVDCVKELIAKGADVNAQDQHGETALMAAAKTGHTVCIAQLLQPNALLNITDNEGNTALIYAIMGRKIECVKQLITAGTDVNKGNVPPLICSIRSRSFDSINELLKAGADVNGADDHKNTALIEAVRCGKNTIVQLLLLKGADTNAENTEGHKAIHLAAERSHQEFKRQQSNVETNKEIGELKSWPEKAEEFARVVNMRLNKGVPSNIIQGYNQQTIDLDPPKYKRPDFHILKMLLAAGAEMEGMDMFSPGLRLKRLVRYYIREHWKKFHPKPNLFVTIEKLDLLNIPRTLKSYLLLNTITENKKIPNLSDDQRSLFSNSFKGDMEGIYTLIDNKVNVNVKNKNGMTPLMIAAQNGYVELAKILIQAGADVKTSNSLTGDTSLILASENGQTMCVQTLLKCHANVNIQGRNGDTALISAARNGNEDCLQVLKDKGANLNIQNNNGNTALIAAVHRFQFQCAVQLIRAGADVNLMDNQGNTAIVLAARKGQVDIAQKLITAGSDVNYFDEQLGMTALMRAACEGHATCMSLLIQSGADLNIPDVNGKTALMSATCQGHVNCMTLLIKSGADLNIRDVNGRTALMRTAELASFDENINVCFSSLLKAGAEIQITNLADIASKLVQKEGREGTQKLAIGRFFINNRTNFYQHIVYCKREKKGS